MHSPMLRTTIAIGRGPRLEQSIRFYKELLGWEVKVDLTLDAERESGELLGIPNLKHRIVAMGHPDAAHGWIGLSQYLEPEEVTAPPLEKRPNQAYPVAFVFRTTDIQGTYDKARALGATVVCPPTRVHYPGKAPGWGMTCLDPNGVLVDFTDFDDKLL